jgi:hypothetical protein
VDYENNVAARALVSTAWIHISHYG